MLICLFLLCSLPAPAQEDSVEIKDTVKLVLPDEIDSLPVTEEKNEKDYFLKKQDYYGDSLKIEQRNIPDSLVKKLQQDKDFWYANENFEKKTPAENTQTDLYIPISQRTWFQTLIWLIIIGGFAAFLMIYLSSNNVGLFRKKNKVSATGEEEIATEDIFAINYQKEIDKSVAQGNYRLAIRLMFLRLLKNMSEKNIIKYQQDKTNLDYLMQLHPTKYYNNFFRITRNYEYSWYGQFEVSEAAYKIIRNEFDHFENGLK